MSSLARERQVLKPAQLNALARDLLEGSFAQIWVEGEISNFARPASGHAYFTLKDDRAQVRCALFKANAQRLRFQPRDGQRVLARGRLTLYEPRGDYQLVLDHLEEAGEGALRQALEALKTQLAAEGLFDAARKRALPAFVGRLGLITSPRGAAVRDVLSVLARRFPLIEVEVLPVPVQGEGAAAQITGMLQRAGACGRYDALLITRGGGSLEDLRAFNDEALARAIAASPVPVVSAVGHEIDTSLSDLAADLRAATPSAAAELLVPDQQAVRAHVQQLQASLTRHWRRAQTDRSQRCDLARLRLERAEPRNRLDMARQRLALLAQRQQQAYQRQLQQRRLHLQGLARALESVSPLATLGRGYSLLQRSDGSIVRQPGDVRIGEPLRARLAIGSLTLRVESAAE